jgi:hypothetical protein
VLNGSCIFLINKRTISSSSALHGAQDRKALDWWRKQQQAKQQLQAPGSNVYVATGYVAVAAGAALQMGVSW